MGDISNGSEISSIRGGDFELGASGISAPSSVGLVIEDVTPTALMPLESDLGLVLGSGSATFTRATTGTFEDRNDGLVKSSAIDAARFERQGLLIEGARTNLLLRSQEIDNASWTKVNAPTITTNIAVAPDGTTTADGIQSADAVNFKTIRQINVVAGNSTLTASTFVKKETSETFFGGLNINFTGGTGKIAYVIFDATDGSFVIPGAASITPTVNVEDRGTYWYVRVTATDTGANTSGEFSYYGTLSNNGTSLGTGAGSVRTIWGNQLELAPFASSYDPTAGTNPARALDDFSIDPANIPSPTEDYSVCMKVKALGFDSGTSQVLSNVDGETSRRIQWNTTTGAIEAIHGAVTSASTSTFSAGDSVKVCFAVDGANQTLYINGVQEDQDAKGTVTGSATAIDIGHQAGANQAFSYISDYRIYDAALTASQAKAI